MKWKINKINYKPILTVVLGFTDSIDCCFTVNVLCASSISLIAPYPFRDFNIIRCIVFRLFNHSDLFIE